MKIKSSIVLGLMALGLSSASAGTPAPDLGMIVDQDPGLGANISVGYDSAYIFRGVKFADNSVWGQVDAAFDIATNLSFDFGAWYETSASDQYDELDVWAGLSTTVGAIDVSAGFLWYYFPSVGGGASSDTQEVFYSLGTEVAGLSVGFTHAYDFVPDGHYLAIAAGKSIDLSDNMALELSAGVSYNIDYFVDDSGWNNVDVSLSLPISLTSSATLTPYIAYSHALGVLEDDGVDDYLYGGVSLNVSF